jgi:xanthine dehydrogenase molybdopterin-binding subunit B
MQSHVILPHFYYSLGTVPVIFVTETMMNHVAKAMNKSPDEIRKMNFYKKGQV